jgi:hypothetical protein
MATHLAPEAPYVQRFRIQASGPIEIAPGVFRRISRVTGDLETHITPEGLATLRRRQLAGANHTHDALAARARIAPDPTSRTLLEVAHVMRRCAGNRRRQRGVRR